MSVKLVDNAYKNLIPKMGKDAIAAVFPKDFELYLTALELVNSEGLIAEYFIFPINPSSITKVDPQINNVQKTIGGSVTTSTQTFVPCDITINGNFGRKFKFLMGGVLVNFAAFRFSEIINKNSSNFNNQVFSDIVKTGYGCIKILQRIIQKHNQLDEYGNPYTLNFYNLSFGESYIVKVVNQPTFSQSLEKNMIWDYAIQFKALAPLDQISDEPTSLSNLKLLGYATIQNTINSQSSILANVL